MKTLVRSLLGLATALAGLGSLSAQTAATSSGVAPPPASRAEEAVVLSPFEVSTSKDVGFVAASSLAGGRLAGDLKDTPVAYSVLTREFLDALDINDLMEASEWTVNTTSLQGAGQEEIFGNGFELSSRGVSMGEKQRNFFPLNVNFDSYNLDRFDYSRGANAILFGQGSFGGAANAVTKRAQFAGNAKSTGRITYGSWDNRRVTLDDNRVLSDRFALRTNLLWLDRQGWRDFEMEKKQAVTLAATWRIAEPTELLLEGEVGRIDRNNPPTFLNDQITGWDGATTYAGLVTNAKAPTSGAMAVAGVSRIGNDTSPYWVFARDLGMATVENYANTMRTIGGGASATTPIGGVPFPAGGASSNYQSRPITEALNAPAWRFDRAIAGSQFRVPPSSFAMSTLAPTNQQTYQSYSAFLRHRIGSNFFLEAAANFAREARRTQYINGRSLNDVIIDVNERLPNGAPNPQFLDVYGDGQRSRGSFGNDYTSGRVAAAYQLERTRVGDFVFNLMGGVTNNDNYQRIESMRVLRDADSRNWPYNDQVYYRYYWQGPSRELPGITSATLGGVTYPVQWIGDSQRATDISYTRIRTNYLQGAAKGKFFSNRLQVLLAGRRDQVKVKRTINDFYADYPADWPGGTEYHYREDAPADYLTLSDIRPRNATTRIPLSASGRYQDDYNPPVVNLNASTYSTGAVWHVKPWLSLFGNYATSFNPSTSQLRLDGSLVPSPVSKGTDVGIRFYLLKERLNVSLARYAGEETAQPFEISFTSAIQNIALANKTGDTSSDGSNQRGLPVVPRQAFDLRDRENSGYEIEVTANLSRNWRLTANAAKAEGRQTNAFRDTLAFLDQWQETMRQVVIDSGNRFDATGKPVSDGTSSSISPDASSARNGWITIFQNNLPNIVSDPQKMPGLTEASANIFTDYQFSDGRLKGLRVGGGVNYRGKKAIGFRGGDTMQDPAQPTNFASAGAIDDPKVDAFTPVYSDPYTIATVTLSYAFRLRNRRSVSLQLRVANLFDNDTPVYTGATVQRAPGGDYTQSAARVATPVNFRYQTPRSYSLTATMNF